jgi:hypothetical protein
LRLHAGPELQRGDVLGPEVELVFLGVVSFLDEDAERRRGGVAFFGAFGMLAAGGLEVAARQQPRGITQFFSLPFSLQAPK